MDWEKLGEFYMNDTIVFSPSPSRLIEHLESAFERVREFGLKLLGGKNIFGASLNEESNRTDPPRVDPIVRVQLPINKNKLKNVLGKLLP